MKISVGVAAIKMPLKPPMINIETNEMANSIGEVYSILPPHMVPSQLKVLIALGKAIIMVAVIKVIPSIGFMPETNIWWPQTIKPKPAMPEIE